MPVTFSNAAALRRRVRYPEMIRQASSASLPERTGSICSGIGGRSLTESGCAGWRALLTIVLFRLRSLKL